MKKILGVAVLAVLFAAPAYATGEGASRSMSYVEFVTAPENHGAPLRTIQKRFEDYKSGRLPAATLDVSRIR